MRRCCTEKEEENESENANSGNIEMARNKSV